MDIDKQAGKNFAWLSTAQVGIRILGAAFFFFLSYILKDTGLGQYSFVASLVPFWFILVDFGASGYLYREWTRGKDDLKTMDRDFNILFTTRLIIISAVFIPFVAINYVSNRDILSSLILLFIALFISQMVGLYDLYLQSANRFNVVAIRQVIEKLVVTAVATVGLLLLPKVYVVFFAILVSYIGALLYYRYRANLPFRFHLVFDWARSKELFRKGMPFVFLGMFAAIYGRIDMIMLRYFSGFEAVGWYSVAYKFLDISFVFPSLFLASIFPLLSSLYAREGSAGQFAKLFEKSFRVLFSFGVLVAVFFMFFAPRVIDLFFIDSFAPAAPALRILMVGQMFAFLSLLFSNLLIVQRKEYKGLYVVMACALLNIALNILLIPKFSLYGAAWATVAAELVNLAILQHYAEWKTTRNTLMTMFAVSAGNLALFAIFHIAGLLDVLWLGIVALLCNFALLFAVRLVNKNDILLFLDPFVMKFKSLLRSNQVDTV
ncbi:hypothetical protein A2524_00575 [Candidatus Wolfebacteria bacterium RIFOXYD12_FULL_48_21]|uniref:Uncharacterized protein n=1 Tax=Candidatus Wolfebacteria bacterium RIFOXYD1_FULL_48_65 TaxID=1802561 RepID=A0A1F8DZB8_9BACT|nr:MAG: hypothetical protein A2610_00360 [Candidatus Wolfebacteria bacterium RIFOXYD1_FULL_48_65]OGM94310.1 MAG: hypothetical protein A2524_00575 [Candidatus Wolfebacteria bacterium RIFOXYD12_FULL_48_21]OGM95892.1 MAG: hypothetical protein A2532_02495 [Candidatus Wolfebacteria bacterium RIFOXYD2_FULL_48_11]